MKHFASLYETIERSKPAGHCWTIPGKLNIEIHTFEHTVKSQCFDAVPEPFLDNGQHYYSSKTDSPQCDLPVGAHSCSGFHQYSLKT